MTEEITFLTYAQAKKVVGNVIEEEHIRETDRRILTVYDVNGKEICWFDAEEVMTKVGCDLSKKMTDQQKEDYKIAAVEYVLNRIPDWSVVE